MIGTCPVEGRQESDVRVADVTGAVHRALVECLCRTPDLTEEEMLAALLDVSVRKAQRLRRQATPAAGQVAGDVPAAWVAAFDRAVAAVGCVNCGSIVPCRCYVPADRRPSKTTAGLAAVLPLITAALNERVTTDANC